MIFVMFNINLTKFILIHKGISIYQEIIIMANVLHKPLTGVCALILSCDLFNPIGVTIISSFVKVIIKAQNCHTTSKCQSHRSS